MEVLGGVLVLILEGSMVRMIEVEVDFLVGIIKTGEGSIKK